MRSDVHSAALRAAAKVAFSVAFIGGCSAPASSDPADDDAVSTSDELAKGCEKDRDASSPSPLTCEQAVRAAFPVEGDYPGTKQAVSVRVQTCCVELLEESRGMLGEHRWDCCANLPANAGPSVGIACTPWGPPVPPSMTRRSKRATKRSLGAPTPTKPTPDAWVALAEVA